MMNLVANLDFILGCVFLMVAVYCFNLVLIAYREYVNTKYKFMLYALRDELTMVVLRGEVKEDEDQFQCLNRAINYSIAAAEDLSIQKIIQILKTCITNDDRPTNIRITNKEIFGIAIQYLEIHKAMIRKNSWFELWLMDKFVRTRKSGSRKNRRINIVLPRLKLPRLKQLLQRPIKAIEMINKTEGAISGSN